MAIMVKRPPPTMRPATERELADVRDTPCGREFGVLRMSVSEDGRTSRILFGKVKSDVQETAPRAPKAEPGRSASSRSGAPAKPAPAKAKAGRAVAEQPSLFPEDGAGAKRNLHGVRSS